MYHYLKEMFTRRKKSYKMLPYMILMLQMLDHRYYMIHRRVYMNAHVLLNLLNKLGKRDKMRGLLSILSLFRNSFNKFNNTGA